MDFKESLKNIKNQMINKTKEEFAQAEHKNTKTQNTENTEQKEQRLRKEFLEFIKDEDIKRK